MARDVLMAARSTPNLAPAGGGPAPQPPQHHHHHHHHHHHASIYSYLHTQSGLNFAPVLPHRQGDGVEGVSGGGGGGSAELSDAELQAALRELDALLQRPPGAAQPPDPEKVLLKRALTLALAALERTSDACLKLVNFTADAFEGMAATEA